jgi:hypothetical protein
MFRLLLYRETVWGLKVKEALVRSVYHIMQYTVCCFILQVIELASGVTQSWTSWVRGLFPRGRVDRC